MPCRKIGLPTRLFHARLVAPYDRYNCPRSVQPRFSDWRLLLEIYQQRLRSTAAANRWGWLQLFSSTTDLIFILHRRTFHRTVRTKDAAVARLRAQQRFAVRALVEKLACVGRQRFSLSEAANGAYEHGFKKNFVHSRLSCRQRKDSPHLQSLRLAHRDSLYQDQTKRWQFSYRNPLALLPRSTPKVAKSSAKLPPAIPARSSFGFSRAESLPSQTPAKEIHIIADNLSSPSYLQGLRNSSSEIVMFASITHRPTRRGSTKLRSGFPKCNAALVSRCYPVFLDRPFILGG